MGTPSAPRRARSWHHPHRGTPVRVRRVPAAIAALLLVLAAACGSSTAEDAGGRTTSTAPASSPSTPSASPTTEVARPEGPTSSVGTQPATLDDVPAAAPEPIRLEIPAIGVDVDVRPVGVEDDGDMEVPPPEVAGWYRFGPRPGEGGSAVLAAHVDWDGRAAAFFRLAELGAGDEVVVTMADGSVLPLVVTGTDQVAKDDLTASGVFARSGAPRVALITCGGEFDRTARSYRDNVVVHAEPRR